MNLLKNTIFIQHSSKSRTANATAFVEAGQFSRGKEITKQWNYYETQHCSRYFIRGWVKSGTLTWRLTKRKILLILEYFKMCFYFHGHQKGAHLWQRGAIQGGATEVWVGAVAPNCSPMDPPLPTHIDRVVCLVLNFGVAQSDCNSIVLSFISRKTRHGYSSVGRKSSWGG